MAHPAIALKDDGNNFFRDGHYEDAISKYTAALSLKPNEKDSAIIHRNRAACHLKLENYPKAVADSTAGKPWGPQEFFF